MLDNIHVHLPWRHFDKYLPFILEHRLNPEIALRGPDLDAADQVAFLDAGRILSREGLSVTLHAPFADLNPGALEPLVFDATLRRYRQALEVSNDLGARLVVFHPGYDRWKYGGNDHLWHDQNLLFWPSLLPLAEKYDCRMALENIYEEIPDTLVRLLDEIDSPWLGHCFDVGHSHVFGKVTITSWFKSLGHKMIHAHLHDNHGKADEHLPVGEGTIDFSTLFRLFAALPNPLTLTLEAHDPESVLKSIAGMSPFLR